MGGGADSRGREGGREKGNILMPKQKNGEELGSGSELLLCPLWLSPTSHRNRDFGMQTDNQMNQWKALWVRAVYKRLKAIILISLAINCIFL